MSLGFTACISNSCTGGLGRSQRLTSKPVSPPTRKFAQTMTPRSPRRFNFQLQTTTQVKFNVIIPDPPISPQDALDKFSGELTLYEQSEIQRFPEIYFIGSIENKEDTSSFDTVMKYYKVSASDHIAYRYEIERIFLKDEYGTVLLCIDHKLRKKVLLRALPNTLEMRAWGESFIQKTLDFPGVVKIGESFTFRKHIFIEFAYTGDNLYSYIKKYRFWECESHRLTMPPMQTKYLKKIARDILIGICSLHRQGIVHGGLCPHVIIGTEHLEIIGYNMSTQKQPLIYRSPETIMMLEVGAPSDMWSFGCIFAEILNNKPLFSGRTDVEVFNSFSNVIGAVPKPIIARSERRKELLGLTVDHTRIPSMRIQSLANVAKSTNLRVVSTDSRRFHESLLNDLLERCLEWWPSKRITAEEALKHPWLTSTENDNKSWKKAANNLPNLSLRI